jgi:hypothetical protein
LELTKIALKSEKKERLSIIATLIKAEDAAKKNSAKSRVARRVASAPSLIKTPPT